MMKNINKKITAKKSKTIRKVLLYSILTVLIAPALVLSRDSGKTFPVLTGPYLGQKAPVEKAGVFLDGVISTLDAAEMNSAFTADGKEFYYCARYKGEWSIFVTREKNGKWTPPAPLNFTAGYVDRDFTMSPDGNSIYFGSNRPAKKGGPAKDDLDIFVTKRLPSGLWSVPASVGSPVNTGGYENYPCVSANRNLYYFTRRNDGQGKCDLYLSRYVDNRYTAPVNLGPAVNSPQNDWDAYIAPDESYIIFSSQERPGTIGGQDLYISFKKKDGTWTPSKNMGPAVNSTSGEICPAVSNDGKYFLFTTRRRGKADIYWMTTAIIKKLEK